MRPRMWLTRRRGQRAHSDRVLLPTVTPTNCIKRQPLRGGDLDESLIASPFYLRRTEASNGQERGTQKMPSLQDLPLPLAVIIAAFYIINANNAEFAKRLVALISEFTGKYEAVLETMSEDRRASSDRWLERDRLLNERLERNTIAQEKNANEAHALRNIVTPLVLNIEAERKRGGRGGQNPPRGAGGGSQDASD
jgi:hypothetical protein